MRSLLTKGGRALAVIGLLAYVFVPYYFLLLVSFTPQDRVVGFEVPKYFTAGFYREILSGHGGFVPHAINSAIVTLGAMSIAVLLAAPCSYVLSRWKSRVSQSIYFSFLVFRLFPPIALAIPYFVAFSRLHLIDSRLGLTLVLAATNLPLAIWLLRGFFLTVPTSLEEAAWVDGATVPQSLAYVVLPISLQGVAVAGFFVFLMSYIDYVLALTLTDTRAATLPVYIAGFRAEYQYFVGEILAAAILGTLPMIILYLLAQTQMKRFVLAGFSR